MVEEGSKIELPEEAVAGGNGEHFAVIWRFCFGSRLTDKKRFGAEIDIITLMISSLPVQVVPEVPVEEVGEEDALQSTREYSRG